MASCVRDSALLHVRATLQNQQQQSEVTEAVLARLEVLDARLPKGQRQAAVQPLAAHGEAALLARIKHRLDRAGYKWPEVTVTWQDLCVTRTAVPADESVPNLLQPLTQLFRRQQPSSITALQPTSGVLRPGSLTLLLGPAGCGRSTLLKALCDQLHSSSMVCVQGLEQLRYNGQTTDTFVVQRTAAYVDQVDSLLPTLTCRETLNFAEQCCGPSGNMGEAVVQMMSWEEAHKPERCPMDDEADKLLVRMLQTSNLLMTEWSLTILGLQHRRGTLVGDALLRGVSGGEKRRVTVGEGLVGPAMVLMLDEATVGLDSSSTLALVQSMSSWAKLLNTTIVMALQQPEPAVTALFDDVILMAEGYTLWHGPVSETLAHFEGVTGVKALPGQDLADYLMQVAAAPTQQQQQQQGLLVKADGSSSGRGSSGSSVMSAAQLSAAFWESRQGSSLKAAASTVMTPTNTQLSSLVTKQMRPAWPVLLAACTKRMFKIDLARNWEACVMRWTLAVFIGVVMGLLFYQLPVNFAGGVNFLGMIYQGLFFLQLLSLPTIEMTFEKRPILFRQRDALYHPAWVEWLPAVMLNVPILLVDVMLYGSIIYVMIGFTLSASAYFTFQLVLLGFALVCDNICRAYGSAAKVLNIALGVGVCQALVNEMLAGFVMTPSAIPSYWIWAYYINPQAHAFRALALNELTQPRWSIPTAVTAGSTGSNGSTLGNDILDLFQVKRDGNWVWDGVGVLLGMAGICAGVSLVAYTYNKLTESPAVQPQQQQQQQQQQQAVVRVDEKSSDGEEKEGQTDEGAKHASSRSGAVVVELPASAILAAAVSDTAAAAEDTEAAEAAAGGNLTTSNISIAFRGLSYFVPDPQATGSDGGGGKKAKGGAELQLLDGVTGSFRPGVLTALMGPSGAGKSTLIDVILGRKTAGHVVGEVRVCGVPQGSTRFSRLVGYCEQADIHVPLATVREALEFSAALRLTAGNRSSSGAGRSVHVAAAVDEVLRLVELEPLAARLVGTPGVDGLSTEQRKRLTMAVELVTQPRVLFCDEPTSGLDGRGAMMVARVMQAVTCRGVAVVSTIHQPSAAIFGMFDELLLLQRGGKIVFNGPLGADAVNLVRYLQGAVPAAPAFVQGTCNPASWMFEVLNSTSSSSKGTIDLAAIWQSSSQAQAIHQQVDQLCLPPASPSATASLTQSLNPAAPAGAFQKLAALLNRNFLSYWRNPSVNLARFGVTLLMAVIVGSIEWGKGNTAKIHDARGIQNCMGGIFILASALAVEIGFECQGGVAKERPVFYRERAAGCYGSGVFLAAQAMTETAYISLQVLVYTIITFFMLQLAPTPALFFYVLALIWFSCVVQYATAQALVHVTPGMYLATTLLSVLSMLQGLVGGFTRPLPATHKAWWPAFFLNPSFYTFIGIGTEVLGDVKTLIPDPAGAASGGFLPVNEYIQGLYGMGRGVFPGAWGSLGMLGAMTAVMLAVSFVGLRWGRFNRR